MELNESAVNLSIKNLKSINLEAVTIEEIEELLAPLFEGYTINAPKFNSGVLIYRGRICSKPTHYSEIIYPKQEFIKKYGRANNIGQSLFYGGVGKGTPLMEIGAQSGDTIVLSHWITTESMLLNHVGFSNLTKYRMKSKRDLEKIYKFVEDTKNYKELNNFVYNFLASKFIDDIGEDDNWKYKLTVAITNKLISEPLNGIMYPSIKSFGNSDNIVLKPEYVDKALKLVSIQFIKIIEKTGEIFRTELLDTATKISDDGSINWSGRQLSMKGKIITSSIENNEVISKDINGNFIFPTCDGALIRPATPILNAFKKGLPHSLKISKDISITTNNEVVQPIVELIYDLNTKSSYLSFYIPVCEHVFNVIDILVSNHLKFSKLFDEFTTEITDKKIVEQSISNSNFSLLNKIKLFTEQNIDISDLQKKHSNVKLMFVHI